MNQIINFVYKVFDNSEYLILMGLVFIAVSLSSFGIIYILTQKDQLKQRLNRFIPSNQLTKSPKNQGLVRQEAGGVAKKIDSLILESVMPQKEEILKEGRLKLLRAGIQNKNAYRYFLLAKLFCAIFFTTGFLFVTFFYRLSTEALISGIIVALLSFFLPSLVVKLMTLQRQAEITRALPDALDLMVVCAEAGLGLDMTFKRVGEEIKPLSEALSEEFNLTVMEVRAGKDRSESFRNIFLRTGVQELSNLMTILAQASRFGTSIANALRVHADSMRVKRRQIAEEKAAKVSVKLIFPLILFIFPALMIVIGGPAFLAIFRVLFPALTGIG